MKSWQAPLPMDFPGKNTGVGCHFLLPGILPKYQTCASCLGKWILYQLATVTLWTVAYQAPPSMDRGTTEALHGKPRCSLNLFSFLPPPGHIETPHFPSSSAVSCGPVPKCHTIGCGRSAFVNWPIKKPPHGPKHPPLLLHVLTGGRQFLECGSRGHRRKVGCIWMAMWRKALLPTLTTRKYEWKMYF